MSDQEQIQVEENNLDAAKAMIQAQRSKTKMSDEESKILEIARENAVKYGDVLIQAGVKGKKKISDSIERQYSRSLSRILYNHPDILKKYSK